MKQAIMIRGAKVTRHVSLSTPFSLGSGQHCDLFVEGEGIAPLHLTITPEEQGARMRISDDSSAPVLLNGNQVTGSVHITSQDQIETAGLLLSLTIEETWRSQWFAGSGQSEVVLRSLYRLLKLTNGAEDETVFLQDALPVLADGVQASCATVVVRARGGRMQRLRTVGDPSVAPEHWFDDALEAVLESEVKRVSAEGSAPLLFAAVKVPDWLEVVLCFARRPGAEPFQTAEEDLASIVCRQASATIRRLRLSREARMLEQRVLEIEETEQRRIGQDLHDGLCQDLIGIGFLTAHLHRSLNELDSPLTAEAAKIKELLGKATDRARGLARGLSPVSLEEEYGLTSALRELAEGAESVFGIPSRFVCSSPVPVGDPQVAGNLFFLAREAVINAAKHSEGKSVHVELTESEDQITIVVRDDGIGLPEQPRGGLGLKLMQHRAKAIKAELSFSPAEGGGLCVRCVWVKPRTDASTERHVLCSEALLEPVYLGRGMLHRIGRDRTADVRLRSHKVSRYHAELRWDGNCFVLTDVGSTNGTTVNGVEVQGRTPLTEEATISFGGCEVLYRILPPGEDSDLLKEGTQQIHPRKVAEAPNRRGPHAVETSRNLDRYVTTEVEPPSEG